MTKPKSRKSLKCTKSRDDVNYYYSNGKRISRKKASSIVKRNKSMKRRPSRLPTCKQILRGPVNAAAPINAVAPINAADAVDNAIADIVEQNNQNEQEYQRILALLQSGDQSVRVLNRECLTPEFKQSLENLLNEQLNLNQELNAAAVNNERTINDLNTQLFRMRNERDNFNLRLQRCLENQGGVRNDNNVGGLSIAELQNQLVRMRTERDNYRNRLQRYLEGQAQEGNVDQSGHIADLENRLFRMKNERDNCNLRLTKIIEDINSGRIRVNCNVDDLNRRIRESQVLVDRYNNLVRLLQSAENSVSVLNRTCLSKNYFDRTVDKFSELNTQISSLQRYVQINEQRIVELDIMLQNEMNNKSVLSAELESLRETCSDRPDLKKSLANAIIRLTEQENIINTITGNIETERKLKDQALETSKQLRETLDVLQSQMVDSSKFEGSEEEKNLNTTIIELRQEMNKRIDSENARMEESKELLNRSVSTIRELQNKLDDQQKIFQNQIKRSQSTIDSLQEKLKRQKEDCLEEMKAALNSKSKVTDEQVDRYEKTINGLNETLESLKNSNRDLQKSLDQCTKIHENDTYELKERDTTILYHQAEYAKLVNILEEEKNKCKENIESLQNARLALLERIRSLDENNKLTESKAENLEKKLLEYESKIDKNREKIIVMEEAKKEAEDKKDVKVIKSFLSDLSSNPTSRLKKTTTSDRSKPFIIEGTKIKMESKIPFKFEEEVKDESKARKVFKKSTFVDNCDWNKYPKNGKCKRYASVNNGIFDENCEKSPGLFSYKEMECKQNYEFDDDAEDKQRDKYESYMRNPSRLIDLRRGDIEEDEDEDVEVDEEEVKRPIFVDNCGPDSFPKNGGCVKYTDIYGSGSIDEEDCDEDEGDRFSWTDMSCHKMDEFVFDEDIERRQKQKYFNFTKKGSEKPEIEIEAPKITFKMSDLLKGKAQLNKVEEEFKKMEEECKKQNKKYNKKTKKCEEINESPSFVVKDDKLEQQLKLAQIQAKKKKEEEDDDGW